MKHTLAIKYSIGDFITANKAYPLACSDRFPGGNGERPSTAVPCFTTPRKWIVLGGKRKIMTNYKFTNGKTFSGSFEEPYTEYQRATATGSWEEVLIVCESFIKPQPFLIRPEDIIEHTPVYPFTPAVAEVK